MSLDILKLLLTFIPVCILYYLLVYKMHDKLEKIYTSIIFWGLYFYGGIGSAATTVQPVYTFYFLVFLLAFVFFYRLRYIFPNAVKNSLHKFYAADGKTFFDGNFSTSLFIWIYLFICFLSLLYPTIKVGNLIAPPAPDVLSALLSSIDKSTENADIILKLMFYARLLFLPLYYLSLYKFSAKPLLLFALIFLPLYFDYCSSSYVGRGMILIDFALWLLVVYKFNKKIRKPLIISTVVIAPLLLAFFYTYSVARLGGSADLSLNSDVIGKLFYTEINFPESFQTVVESGRHINFAGFLIWIFTLPFPKFIFGSLLNVPIINFELSEIVLNLDRNDPNFWVKLTGYVTESWYIFGTYFFWVEALIVAWIAKAIFYFLRRIKGSEILIFFVAIQFGFMFSRAGLGAVLPLLTNGFLAIYFYFAIKLRYAQKKSSPSANAM